MPAALARVGEVEDGRDQEDQQDDRLELAGQIRVGPLPDRPGDHPHLLGPLVGPEHLPDQHPRVEQARHRHHEHDQQGHALQPW